MAAFAQRRPIWSAADTGPSLRCFASAAKAARGGLAPIKLDAVGWLTAGR